MTTTYTMTRRVRGSSVEQLVSRNPASQRELVAASLLLRPDRER